jgi:hypothetical protein
MKPTPVAHPAVIEVVWRAERMPVSVNGAAPFADGDDRKSAGDNVVIYKAW